MSNANVPAILVINDERRDREILHRILKSAGFRVSECKICLQALDEVRAGNFDAVVLDPGTPGSEGFELLRALESIQPKPKVIVITAYSKPLRDGIFESAIRLGAVGVMDQAQAQESLVPLLRDLPEPEGRAVAKAVNSTAAHAPLRIMVIENDAPDARLILRELKRGGFAVQADVIQTRDEFEHCLEMFCYDAVLSDYNLPGWTGTDAVVELRRRGLFMPVILVTGTLGEETAVESIKQGASDYVLKDRMARLPVALGRALAENKLREDRARAEEELRQRESQFRALIEHSADGTLLVAPEGAFLPGPITAPLLGHTPGELSGHTIFELIHPADVAQAREIFARMLKTASWPFPYELRCRHRDGSWRWIEGTAKNLLADAAVKAVVIHCRDITDRKKQEREIERLNRDLEQRVAHRTAELESLHHQTKLILSSAGDAIFRVDSKGKCTYSNPAAALMLGYSAEGLLGQDLHVMARHCLADGSPCPGQECVFHAPLKLGTVARATGHNLQRRDGNPLAVDAVITPVVEKDQVVGAVIAIRDVSERRAMEKMKEEFVSMVSHELRVPLTAIRGALGLLAAQPRADEPERSRRMLEVAVNHTDRLIRLVGNILDSAHLESGAPLIPQPCIASDLMLQAIELMRPMAESASVVLEVSPQQIPLSVDTDGILQVLSNLLGNAIKFSARGSMVRLECACEDGSAIFRVIDQGTGIPKEKLESIFGRFQPVDRSDSRRRGGTGLGLSICRGIVQRHGGKIWAESELGHGSTFVFTLPAARAT